MQQNMPNATIKSILEALKEDEHIRQMGSLPDAATDALSVDAQRRYRGERGRGHIPAASTSLWCSFCSTATHNLVDCRSKGSAKRARRGSTNAPTDSGAGSMVCYHCAEMGHRVATCPVKRRADEARHNYR